MPVVPSHRPRLLSTFVHATNQAVARQTVDDAVTAYRQFPRVPGRLLCAVEGARMGYLKALNFAVAGQRDYVTAPRLQPAPGALMSSAGLLHRLSQLDALHACAPMGLVHAGAMLLCGSQQTATLPQGTAEAWIDRASLAEFGLLGLPEMWMRRRAEDAQAQGAPQLARKWRTAALAWAALLEPVRLAVSACLFGAALGLAAAGAAFAAPLGAVYGCVTGQLLSPNAVLPMVREPWAWDEDEDRDFDVDGDWRPPPQGFGNARAWAARAAAVRARVRNGGRNVVADIGRGAEGPFANGLHDWPMRAEAEAEAEAALGPRWGAGYDNNLFGVAALEHQVHRWRAECAHHAANGAGAGAGGPPPAPFDVDSWALTAGQRADLCRFLARLRRTAEYNTPRVRGSLVQRTGELLGMMQTEPALRERCLERINAYIDSCEDGTMVAMNNLELLVRLHRAENAAQPRAALEELGLSLLRLEAVDRHATRWCAQNPRALQVEAYLYFHTQLRDVLQLPVTTTQMLYGTQVTQEDCNEAAEAALQAERDPQVRADFFASWAPWQAMLRREWAASDAAQRDNLPVRPMDPAALRQLKCPITQEDYLDLAEPVLCVVDGHANVYEYAALLRYYAERGEDPLRNRVTPQNFFRPEARVDDARYTQLQTYRIDRQRLEDMRCDITGEDYADLHQPTLCVIGMRVRLYEFAPLWTWFCRDHRDPLNQPITPANLMRPEAR